MASMEELVAAKQAEIVEEYDEDQVEDLMQGDMVEAMEILNQVMHLLDYVADAELCKRISKRERVNLAYMAEKVRVFLDDKQDYYEEEEV